MAVRKINSNGYTIMELIVAASISGLILFGIFSSFLVLRKSGIILEGSVKQGVDARSFGNRFVKVLNLASPSLGFLHLPISAKANCLDTEPCIRTLEGGSGEFVNYPNQSIFDKIFPSGSAEFFRDDVGFLDNNLIPGFSSNNGAAKLTYSVPVNREGIPQKDHLYATWPLVDTQSPAFPLMLKTKLPYIFRFKESTATSKPPSAWQILNAQGAGGTAFDVKKLKNQLVVIFDASQPQKFVVQYIKEFISCAASPSFCAKQKTIDHIPLDSTDPNTEVAIQFSYLPDDNLAGLLTARTASVAGGLWPGGQTVNYLFPLRLNVFDFSDINIGATINNQNYDNRKWIHYNHTRRIASNLVVLPVILEFYKIENMSSDSSKKALMRYEVSGNQSATSTAEIVDIKGKIVFEREIGTSNFRVHIFETQGEP
jgi:hypothetical protein